MEKSRINLTKEEENLLNRALKIYPIICKKNIEELKLSKISREEAGRTTFADISVGFLLDFEIERYKTYSKIAPKLLGRKYPREVTEAEKGVLASVVSEYERELFIGISTIKNPTGPFYLPEGIKYGENLPKTRDELLKWYEKQRSIASKLLRKFATPTLKRLLSRKA